MVHTPVLSLRDSPREFEETFSALEAQPQGNDPSCSVTNDALCREGEREGETDQCSG